MYPKLSDDSSTSSSDSEADMAPSSPVSNEEISQLTSTVKENPYQYESHVRLINLLHKAGMRAPLKEARELMSSLYPLTPEMWLLWINDEMSYLPQDGNREPITNLFVRALADYQSVNVYLEQCQFAIGGMVSSDPNQVSNVREIFEAAISKQGLNFSSGSLIWEIFREFEVIVLAQIQSQTTDADAVNSQLKKIDNIYRRQLNVPHSNIQSTLAEYKDFLKGIGSTLADSCSPDGVSQDCMLAFNQSETKMNSCQPFEDEIDDVDKKDDKKLLTAWESYLNWAITNASQKATKSVVRNKALPATLTPAEIICLLERACTDLPLHINIWLRMADFLESNVPADTERLLSTLQRAVRNVPWSSVLWRRYALASESQAWKLVSSLATSSEEKTNGNEHNKPIITPIASALKQTEEIFEASIKCGFAEPTDFLLMWTSYCDFWSRQYLFASDAEMKNEWILDNLRNTFDRALEHLSTYFGTNGDPECSLLHYWAYFEAKHTRDIGRAQGLWTRMLKIGKNGSSPSFWIAYLTFEKNFGDTKHLLRVAGMALNSVTGSFADTVYNLATRCLIEAGLDLHRLREFEGKVRSRRKHLLSANQANCQLSDKPPLIPMDTESSCEQQSDDRKQRSVLKRPAKEDLREQTNKTPKVRCEGVKGVAATTDNVGKRVQGLHGENVPHDPSKDDKTVFVSNLPFKVTDSELREIFKSCGEIASVRLVKDFAGKSKGYAYVEFTGSAAVLPALALDRHPILANSSEDKSGNPAVGRPMFVSVCNANRSESRGFRFSSGVPEPCKLFVRNLDKQVREAALKTFFGQHGQVTNVRLVTFRNGVPKGTAYVEFETEEDASRALSATDGALIGNQTISVAISNPPPRSNDKTSHQFHAPTNSKVPHDSGIRSHAHSQLSFMPRALNRGNVNLQETSKVSLDDPALVSQDAKKSNEDFRKMFIK